MSSIKAENMVVVHLMREQAQELLKLIDDLHEQFQKGDKPDIGLLLQLADAFEDALSLEK